MRSLLFAIAPLLLITPTLGQAVCSYQPVQRDTGIDLSQCPTFGVTRPAPQPVVSHVSRPPIPKQVGTASFVTQKVEPEPVQYQLVRRRVCSNGQCRYETVRVPIRTAAKAVTQPVARAIQCVGNRCSRRSRGGLFSRLFRR